MRVQFRCSSAAATDTCRLASTSGVETGSSKSSAVETGKAAAFAAAQQIDQPKGHRVALRLDDRGLLLIAPVSRRARTSPRAHLSEIGGLIKAAEHREVAEKMRLQKAEEQARQQRPVPQSLRQRLAA